MNQSPRQVYAITLKHVRTFMHGLGFDDVVLLANTELRNSDLDDCYRLISEQQARAFYRNVVDLTEDPGIGLEIGWMSKIKEKGSIGLMQMSARTVGDAIEDGWRDRSAYYGLVEWVYECIDGMTIYKIYCDEDYEPLRVFLLERVLGLFQANAEELVGAEVRPTKVLLDYKAPKNFKRYKEIFNCPVHFEKASVEMHYPLKYLSQELTSYDPQSHEVLEVLQSRLVKKLAAQQDIVDDVKMALRRKPGEFPGPEQVASNMAMSPRTLRRKLGAEGVRFQDLLDAERRKVAEDYLANSNLTIQQIAEQCDFRDAQNFSQAFRRWAGVSPSEYRNSRLE